MQALRLSKPDRHLRGTIRLDGSKSISNRALLILALAGADPAAYVQGLSTSRDTATLQQLLAQPGPVYDAGDAGTTFRFLTAYLATRPGTQVLTGSARMRERPVGALVEALRSMGADIRFLDKAGYPPLQIGEPAQLGKSMWQVGVPADVSSQFLSALLMIGPYLPHGLEIMPEGQLVSRPYLEMTLQCMRYFGAQVDWQGDHIRVEPGRYTPLALQVEADWSAAAFWYTLAIFAEEVDLYVQGLWATSWQGDAVLVEMMESFGIRTVFEPTGIHLSKVALAPKPVFEWDFINCPDLAQALAVACGGVGRQGLFSGLQTLAIKETDRIAALRTELGKIGVSFAKLPPRFSKKHPERTYYLVDGQAQWTTTPRFDTYQDHRVAMSFAPLAMLEPVEISRPDVVAKSYPGFWEHLQQVGFRIEALDP